MIQRYSFDEILDTISRYTDEYSEPYIKIKQLKKEFEQLEALNKEMLDALIKTFKNICSDCCDNSFMLINCDFDGYDAIKHMKKVIEKATGKSIDEVLK